MMKPGMQGQPMPTTANGMNSAGQGEQPPMMDPEHDQLKRDLGVQPHEDIPHEKMQAAMAGQHGPDVQQRAKSVHDKKMKGDAADMDEVFRPAKHTGKDNKAKPMAPSRGAKAPMKDHRYDLGE